MSDLRHLRPGELCRLLNSGPLGAVLSERQLRRHRTRGGLRLGSGQTVDRFRYLAYVLFTGETESTVYLIPSTAWQGPNSLFVSRD